MITTTNTEDNSMGITTRHRRQPLSFAAAVANLEPGEEFAKLQRINASATFESIQATLPAMRDTLRNNIAPAVARAKAETGGQYSVEVTDFMTTSRNWFLIAVVTRTA